MKLYEELESAIEEIVSGMDESPEFKMQFPKIIENFFDESYMDSDLNNAIEKIKFKEGSIGGNTDYRMGI